MARAKIFHTVIGLCLLFLFSILSSCQTSSNKQKTYSLSEQDAETIKSILKFSMGSMDTVSKEMHNDFWQVINKYGGNPNDIENLGSKEHLIDFINETAAFYQRAFYEDALVSLKTGKSFESDKRKKLDLSLDKDRVKKNAALMEKIASKTPIPYNGSEVVFDEEIINGVLENLDAAFILFKHNLDILYSKTYNN